MELWNVGFNTSHIFALPDQFATPALDADGRRLAEFDERSRPEVNTDPLDALGPLVLSVSSISTMWSDMSDEELVEYEEKHSVLVDREHLPTHQRQRALTGRDAEESRRQNNSSAYDDKSGIDSNMQPIGKRRRKLTSLMSQNYTQRRGLCMCGLTYRWCRSRQ